MRRNPVSPQRQQRFVPQVFGASQASTHQGFTLLELLVVLAILGLLSMVALPQLSTLGDRVQFALDRESFERSLATLPYEAFKHRQDFVIAAKDDDQDAANKPRLTFSVQSALPNGTLEPKALDGPVLVLPAPLSIPLGWVIEAETPIVYRNTGFCGGGELVVRIGKTRFPYSLAPPNCEPREK
jgi:prepilin-type N-terminal cleavage/methylation domain-containing protein